MSRARLFVALLVALTAPLLLLQGLANARIAPGPIGWNGFWQADVAQAYLQFDEKNGELELAVQDGGKAMAMAAFSQEPLATNALFLFAADYRSQGNFEAMTELLSIGSALDRRNHRIGAMQLEQAGLAGDLEQTFEIIDRLVRTNPRMAGDFVRPLSLALEDDRLIPEVRERLDEGVSWDGAFWNTIPETRRGVTNMYTLRGMTQSGASPASDARLLAALARVGALDEALDFWALLSGPSANELGFTLSTDFAPVGWQVERSSDRSFSASGLNLFDIYVEDQTFGELARQLVRLKPGAYSFTARVSPASAAGSLEASLECATGDRSAIPTFDTQLLADEAIWSVDESCEVYWLVLSGTAWTRRSPLRASISDMQLLPAD